MTAKISATCPQCGGTEMNVVIGVTNPAMAVAAEALPHGVIMRCANEKCYHFSAIKLFIFYTLNLLILN